MLPPDCFEAQHPAPKGHLEGTGLAPRGVRLLTLPGAAPSPLHRSVLNVTPHLSLTELATGEVLIICYLAAQAQEAETDKLS